MFNCSNMKNNWRHLKNLGCVNPNCNKKLNLEPNEIADYFRSCQLAANEPFNESFVTDSSNSFAFVNVTLDKLYCAFSNVKSNALGPDDIPIHFLKMLLPYIDLHILHIVNSIITTSVFPEC